MVNVVRLFGEKLKLSLIAEVPQSHCRPRLILGFLVKTDKGTPSVNNITNREAAPESLQFGRAFFCIIQAVWESDPSQGPVWVSKLDVTYAYHRGIVTLSQVGAFAYIIP